MITGMYSFHKRLARKIRELRGERTQKNFGTICGVSSATINRCEQAIQNISLKSIETICERLGLEIWDLIPPENELALAEFKAKVLKLADVVEAAKAEVSRLKAESGDPVLNQALDASLKNFLADIQQKAAGRGKPVRKR